MINGLSNSFEELNGLNKLYIDEIETGIIKQNEIDTLNNIDTTKTIQTQLNDIKTIVDNITISGIFTVSNFVLLPVLQANYYTNVMTDDKFYKKSYIDHTYFTKDHILNNYYTIPQIISLIDNTTGIINIQLSRFVTDLYLTNNYYNMS